MTDTLARAIAHFNEQRYREALLAFEERWHAERSEPLRALILLSNALNQLRMGLVTAPRRALATAERLLAADAAYEGVDTAELRAYIARVRACIPEDLETGNGQVRWETVPRLTIERAARSDGREE